MTEAFPATVPPFARACLDAAASSWEASFAHPFVSALIRGELDQERFKFYQMQDARFLEAFADAASLISTRCSDPSDKIWFIDAARTALIVERELHQSYGRKLDYDAEDIARLELTPNNLAFQNHMIASAQRGSLVEAIGALAPCIWLYIAVGRYMLAQLGGAVDEEHPYADWIQMYSDPGFDDYMDNMLSRLQAAADAADEQSCHRAVIAFKTSVRYEYMFWEQAWTRQEWEV